MCIAAIIGQAAIQGAPTAGGPGPQRVAVRAGDTLWGIARAVTPRDRDVRSTVDALAAANDIRAGRCLAAGSSLRLDFGSSRLRERVVATALPR